MEAFRDTSLCAVERAKDLLSRMNTREKIGQLNQRLYGFSIYERDGDNITLTEEVKEEIAKWSGLGVLYGLLRADPWSQRTYESGITAELAAKAHNIIQKEVIEASRFGIPALMSTECPHGHQALDGYLLPVCLAMGATFNVELVQSAFSVVGKQIKSLGVDLALVSVLDVLRDPRWGRSEECFSEDPHVCEVMAEAVISGCMEYGVDVIAKHLCAQGGAEGGLNAGPASIGHRELEEIHLPPAKAAVKAGAAGFMAAYNEIDGVPCHANPKLLRDMLRNEWDFNGVVMADGTAIDRLDILTGDNTKSGALALNSGVDISLWDEGFTKLEEAVRLGYVDEAVLDEAVLRVLTLKFKRGIFENPYLDEKKLVDDYNDVSKYPQSLELARQSAVLLKNENSILPLTKAYNKIAIIGPAADDLYLQLGDYTPPVRPDSGITLWEGIRQFASEETELSRIQGCSISGGCDEEIEKAVKLAEQSDIVILALGGSSSRFSGARFDTNGAVLHDGDVYMDCGEGVDSANLRLPGLQNDLAKAIFAAKTPVITVVTAGRPYAIPDIADGTNGLIYSFYPGPWGGQGIAELIFGEAEPSGRLPASLPRASGQLPCYYNKKASNTDINYYDSSSSPLYQFGYGQSYTSFTIDDVKVDVKSDRQKSTDSIIEVSFTISNKGTRSGYAVPTLYIRWLQGETTPREKELKAFKKIWLNPQQMEKITLELNEADLSRFDREMKRAVGFGDILLILEEGGVEVFSQICRI
ncbi:MAG: glycoside hydrolase family 3 C-terminal domain-containing protein [Oscillospiraceae bacterium]|nr:glycoside hydrolase family 3 C-terminal domain-containing protein [Oscillospiraceae bacterium]